MKKVVSRFTNINNYRFGVHFKRKHRKKDMQPRETENLRLEHAHRAESHGIALLSSRCHTVARCSSQSMKAPFFIFKIFFAIYRRASPVVIYAISTKVPFFSISASTRAISHRIACQCIGGLKSVSPRSTRSYVAIVS